MWINGFCLDHLDQCLNDTTLPELRIVALCRKKKNKQETKLGLVHITLENFEKAASFLRLCLPSTLIRREAFRKRSSKLRKLKTPTFRFRADGKHFKNEAFRNDDVTIIT